MRRLSAYGVSAMPTRKCPSCGAVFDISDRLAGRPFPCDACGKMLSPPRPTPSAPEPGHGAALAPCMSCGRFLRGQIPCPECKGAFCSRECLDVHIRLTGHRASVNLLPFIGAGVLAAVILVYCALAFAPARPEPAVNPTYGPAPARARVTTGPVQVDSVTPQPQYQPPEAVADTTR